MVIFQFFFWTPPSLYCLLALYFTHYSSYHIFTGPNNTNAIMFDRVAVHADTPAIDVQKASISANSIRYIESLYRAPNTPVLGELINCNGPAGLSWTTCVVCVAYDMSVEQMPLVWTFDGIYVSLASRLGGCVSVCRSARADAAWRRCGIPGPTIDLSLPRECTHAFTSSRNPHVRVDSNKSVPIIVIGILHTAHMGSIRGGDERRDYWLYKLKCFLMYFMFKDRYLREESLDCISRKCIFISEFLEKLHDLR